jgi:hypothetical protein
MDYQQFVSNLCDNHLLAVVLAVDVAYLRYTSEKQCLSVIHTGKVTV